MGPCSAAPWLCMVVSWLVGGVGSGFVPAAAQEDEANHPVVTMRRDGTMMLLKMAAEVDLPSKVERPKEGEVRVAAKVPDCGAFDACMLEGQRLGACCRTTLAFENRTCVTCLKSACWLRADYCKYGTDLESSEAPDPYCKSCYMVGSKEQSIAAQKERKLEDARSSAARAKPVGKSPPPGKKKRSPPPKGKFPGKTTSAKPFR